ncbi:MAG: ribonuclease III [Bacteroidales bacterium]|nr:ribonuclease III [Bacteroidales bacterium]
MLVSEKLAYRRSTNKRLSNYINNILGFYPRNISLYELAFTHKSVSDEKVGKCRLSNERLEYLGDAVLEIVVADYLFRIYPTEQEGFLTEMRSRIVSRASLNKLSQKLGFEEYIKHAPDSGGGFRSVGGNAFEALMGAIYLDRGFEFSKKVIIDRIIKMHIDMDQLQQTDVNFKSKLLEWSQKRKKSVSFDLVSEKGNSHSKQYQVQIRIDGQDFGQAVDHSIKGAEQIAAEKTWNMLVEKGIISKEDSSHSS